MENIKGTPPESNEQVRLERIKNLDFVDEAIIGDDYPEKYSIILKKTPDVICLGYDQESFTEKIEVKLKKMDIICEVVRLLPYKPHKYKTTIIKQNRNR